MVPKSLILLRIGVPDRTRTCGPLIKSQLLYQLSYGDILGRGAKLTREVLLRENFLKNYILLPL